MLTDRLDKRSASESSPILGKPLNPRRLVHVDDGSSVDSLALAVFSFARRDSQSGSE